MSLENQLNSLNEGIESYKELSILGVKRNLKLIFIKENLQTFNEIKEKGILQAVLNLLRDKHNINIDYSYACRALKKINTPQKTIKQATNVNKPVAATINKPKINATQTVSSVVEKTPLVFEHPELEWEDLAWVDLNEEQKNELKNDEIFNSFFILTQSLNLSFDMIRSDITVDIVKSWGKLTERKSRLKFDDWINKNRKKIL